MRGKVSRYDGKYNFYRITPAYAGKSEQSQSLKDNPKGSPPPMRGKASADPFHHSNLGITPAYAGKSYVHFLLHVFF